MTKIIEQNLMDCRRCKMLTVHARNKTEMSRAAMLVHFFLVLFTGGMWLFVLLIIWMFRSALGGWSCQTCGSTKLI